MRRQRHSFDDFVAEIEAEAHAEGPGALACTEPRIDRGFKTLAETQRRNALSDEDATALAVRAVREIRAERRRTTTTTDLAAALGARRAAGISGAS